MTNKRTLDEAVSQLKAVISNGTDGFIIVDNDFNIVEYNYIAVRLLRITDFKHGKSVFECLTRPEVKAPLEKIIKSKQRKISINVEYKKYRYMLKITVDDIKNGDGDKIGRILTIVKSPISKKFKKLRESFVANVTHELKTPLTVIKGSVDALLGGALKDKDHATYFIKVISKHTDRLNTLINDILSLSSIEQKIGKSELKMKTVNVTDFLTKLVSFFEEKAMITGVKIHLDCEDGVEFQVDPELIELAISNLIDNAIKYNKENGDVFIKSEISNETVMISVKDTGIGVKERNISRLFERFYRVDKVKSKTLGSTGLGLSIVKQIINAHKGIITVKSRVDVGSSFIITMPIKKEID